MKPKTIAVNISSLAGLALEYMVAKREGLVLQKDPLVDGIQLRGWFAFGFKESATCWVPLNELGLANNFKFVGTILDDHSISVLRVEDETGTDRRGFVTQKRITVWCAFIGQHRTETSTEHQSHDEMFQIYESAVVYGPTFVIAGLRCHVRTKYGEIVDVPAELLDPLERPVPIASSASGMRDHAAEDATPLAGPSP